MKNKNTWLALAVTAIVVVAAAVAIGLLIKGSSKDDNQAAVSRVCGDADVSRYNTPIIGEQPLKDYIEDFGKLYDDIKGRPGNEQDATCQYILYAIAYTKNDDAAKQYVDNIEKLNKEGNYPNNLIYQLRDIKTMRLLLP
jgi:hypothetical protein